MAHRKTAGLLLIGMLAATSCGGSKDGEVYTQPSLRRPAPTTTPPGTAQSDPGAAPGLPGARAALKGFLQGQAAGDSSVCRYVVKDSDFVNSPALKGDCRKGVKNTPHFLRPKERQALGQVMVTGGKITDGEAVLPFSGLRWTDGHLTESSLQSKFVLRRDAEGMWQIIR
ncbi:hypothetical protein GCM10010191_09480 [Actinomadura vinacea]|uniref:Lipoprotein n=1 Tax=Actinomadura vinacea TaxID=115336 RepID=A0ABN3IHU1_9ACTN